jgi:hypothetical protein
MSGSTRAALTAVMTAAAITCAACSGSPAPRPSPSPSRAGLTFDQETKVTPALVACFIAHDLIPAAALHPSASAHPGTDESLWLKNGKVVQNAHFGDWFADVGGGIVVKGRSLGDWTLALEANRKNWPASTCLPMPPA